MAILDCIENILKVGESEIGGNNPYVYALESCKGTEKLDELMIVNINFEIFKRVSMIKERYLNKNDDYILDNNQGFNYDMKSHYKF